MKIKVLWKVPSDMGEHGKKLWRRVGKELVKAESLDTLDYESFETMCRSYDRMKAADRQMAQEGMTVDGGHGVPKKHPCFAIWKTSHDSYINLLKMFGLSPSARGYRVRPREEKKDNGKEKFFA